MVASMIPVMSVGVSAASGITYSSDYYYQTKSALDEEPISFETEISIPTSYSKRLGIIFGNYQYSSSYDNYINFEIQWNNATSTAFPKIHNEKHGGIGRFS